VKELEDPMGDRLSIKMYRFACQIVKIRGVTMSDMATVHVYIPGPLCYKFQGSNFGYDICEQDCRDAESSESEDDPIIDDGDDGDANSTCVVDAEPTVLYQDTGETAILDLTEGYWATIGNPPIEASGVGTTDDPMVIVDDEPVETITVVSGAGTPESPMLLE
jgi:hypothetical protein